MCSAVLGWGINLRGTIYLGGDDVKAAFSRDAALRGCVSRGDTTVLFRAYLFVRGRGHLGGLLSKSCSTWAGCSSEGKGCGENHLCPVPQGLLLPAAAAPSLLALT